MSKKLCCNSKIMYRKCLAVVFTPLIEKELKLFRNYWNTYNIRKTRQGDCISGIPNDLYDMSLYYGKYNIYASTYNYVYYIYIISGTPDYINQVSGCVWATAMDEYACSAPPAYSALFYEECFESVHSCLGLDISRDINICKCLEVYLYLIDNL